MRSEDCAPSLTSTQVIPHSSIAWPCRLAEVSFRIEDNFYHHMSPHPLYGRMLAEKAMRDAARSVQGKNFASLEEANAFIQKVMENPDLVPPPATPLEEAEELMYTLWELDDPRERLKIAMRAVELSMDCADAWVYIADEVTTDLSDAIKCARTGVIGGERALGEDFIRENEGNFWNNVRTRPYMRALQTLAGYLWVAGCYEESGELYLKMLRLHPEDRPGIRHCVAMDFAEADQDALFEAVIDGYAGDPMASFTYGYALWLFRREGMTRTADDALLTALHCNRFVPPYLLGSKRIPKRIPSHFTLGGEDEAVCYTQRAVGGWQATEGALAWLADRKRWITRQKKAKK